MDIYSYIVGQQVKLGVTKIHRVLRAKRASNLMLFLLVTMNGVVDFQDFHNE